jgi:hypothetical protein
LGTAQENTVDAKRKEFCERRSRREEEARKKSPSLTGTRREEGMKVIGRKGATG